jgi:hypothetical protein
MFVSAFLFIIPRFPVKTSLNTEVDPLALNRGILCPVQEWRWSIFEAYGCADRPVKGRFD